MSAIGNTADAVKTVIVKGLGKIKFPASMADDEIAGIIKRHAELDMSEAARMARAKEMGYSETRNIDGIMASYEKGITHRRINGDEYPGNNFFYNMPYDDLSKITSMPTAHKMAYEAGLRNLDPPYLTTGYRYGNAPPNGISFNYMDNVPERGISMAGIDAPENKKWEGTLSAMFIRGNKKKKYYEGWTVDGLTGSDGENLMANAREIKNADRKMTKLEMKNKDGSIRSKFAAFNPELSFSDNILASAAPVAAGVGLASLLMSPKSQANEQRAINRLAELGQSVPTGDAIAGKSPLSARLASTLLKFDTPFDSVTGKRFQSTANILNHWDQGVPNSYGDYFMAAQDWNPASLPRFLLGM